jgi:hypothetical protein
MAGKSSQKKIFAVSGALSKRTVLLGVGAFILIGFLCIALFPGAPVVYNSHMPISSDTKAKPVVFDRDAYNKKMLALAHVNAASTTLFASPALLSSTTLAAMLIQTMRTASSSVSIQGKLWPRAGAYPKVSALLPSNRIVAYYGNFYSKSMGVLGQYPEDTMLAMLSSTTALWKAADPGTPVVPAIHYIAVVAQAGAGFDGKYRARMPDTQIQHGLDLANKINGVLILDVQTGLSNLQSELPLLKEWLKLPNVELAIDPEFATAPFGAPPGHVIGTMSAKDVNYAATFLADIVKENNLPPKLLVVHRFTKDMLTNSKNIVTSPEVQIVIDMDGWGDPAKKIGTYANIVAVDPVQFTGFKLFYKNDLKPPSTRLLTPSEILKLTPAPSYIQYQ